MNDTKDCDNCGGSESLELGKFIPDNGSNPVSIWYCKQCGVTEDV